MESGKKFLKNEFENLVGFWQEDYPSIEQYYIFQTRDCDCGTSQSGRVKIKEAQRQLAVNNVNISVMPTTGMTTHSDNCHYPFTNGYEKFGKFAGSSHPNRTGKQAAEK